MNVDLESIVPCAKSCLLINTGVIAFNVAVSEVHTAGNFRAEGDAATYALLLIAIGAGVLQAYDSEITTDLSTDLGRGDDCTI